MPSVRGRLFSAMKLFQVCGCLSSRIVQSLLFRWGTRLLFLSLTVKKTSTRLTCSLKVATDLSSSGWAGAWLTGEASGEGASWDHPARRGKEHKQEIGGDPAYAHGSHLDGINIMKRAQPESVKTAGKALEDRCMRRRYDEQPAPFWRV